MRLLGFHQMCSKSFEFLIHGRYFISELLRLQKGHTGLARYEQSAEKREKYLLRFARELLWSAPLGDYFPAERSNRISPPDVGKFELENFFLG